MDNPPVKPETPAETVARLEVVPPESRTKAQTRALNQARNAILRAAQEQAHHAAALEARWGKTRKDAGGKDEEGLPSNVPPGESTNTHPRARGSDRTPPDRAKMGQRVLAQLDAALDELDGADPKDRASILSLAAKLSGLLAEQRTEDIPFTFRGWTRAPMPVLPAGVVAPCPACGQALPTVPGGPV